MQQRLSVMGECKVIKVKRKGTIFFFSVRLQR
jgi:hypothetical protein